MCPRTRECMAEGCRYQISELAPAGDVTVWLKFLSVQVSLGTAGLKQESSSLRFRELMCHSRSSACTDRCARIKTPTPRLHIVFFNTEFSRKSAKQKTGTDVAGRTYTSIYCTGYSHLAYPYALWTYMGYNKAILSEPQVSHSEQLIYVDRFAHCPF